MMDLKAPLSEWRQPWIRAGAARAANKAIEAKEDVVCDRQNAAEMDRAGGGMLFRPTSEWERSDREGKVGNGRRAFLLPAGEAYARGFDAIDWSQ